MLLTVAEVAARLRVSRTCVYQLVNLGRLPHHRIGEEGGAIRISEEDLAAYLDGSRCSGTAGASMPPAAPLELKYLTQ